MKKLEKLGNILICDIIMIPVVAFWNTTWNLQDKYLLPDHYVLSNSLSVSVGILGLTVLGCVQFKLTKYFIDKHWCTFLFISRLIALFWAVFGVFHWRGLWNFLYMYDGKLFTEIVFVAAILILCFLRSIRNILAPPFAIGFDGHKEQFFHQTMVFSKIINIQLPFILDVLLSVIILGSLVAALWWDVWTLMDNYLFPNDNTKTIVFSIVIFISIQLLSLLLQALFSFTHNALQKCHYIIQLFFHDVYFIIIGMGNIAGWRGIWKGVDMILEMTGPEVGLVSICLGSFIFLVAVCSCTSLVLKGYVMDGSVEKWYNLFNEYIGNVRSYLQDTKKETAREFEEVPMELNINISKVDV